MPIVQRFPTTLVAIAVSFILILAILVFSVEIIHVTLFARGNVEPHRLDDCLMALSPIVAGVIIDRTVSRRLRYRSEIEAQRLRVLKATARTVQDIVNNFLNNLQLVHLEVEDALSPETRDLLDGLIQDTAAKLTTLGNLESVNEKQLAVGIGIDIGQN